MTSNNSFSSNLPTARQALKARSRCLNTRLHYTSRTISRFYDAALRPTGVRSGQFEVMMVLLASGPLRLRDLAEQIGTDPTTLSRNVDVLQRRGLLKSLRSEDGRERVITNTVSAGLLLSKAVPLWEKTQSLVEHAFGKQNIARLHKDLRGVTEAMLRGSD